MGESKQDGGQAFPQPVSISPAGDEHIAYPGMTLRDWFAGQALGGLLAANATYGGKTGNRSALAGDAYLTADAMIAERSKP